jgi:hypothetical protein
MSISSNISKNKKMCRIFFKQHTEREHMCPDREHMWLCTHCQKSFSARGTHVFMFSHSTATGSSLSIFTWRGSDTECCPKPLARGARSLNRHPPHTPIHHCLPSDKPLRHAISVQQRSNQACDLSIPNNEAVPMQSVPHRCPSLVIFLSQTMK